MRFIQLVFLGVMLVGISAWAGEVFNPDVATSSKAIFYGIAVDQRGQAIPDATVQIEIRRGGFWTGHRSEAVELKSGPDGRFTYDAGKANQMRVVANKEGYTTGAYTAILSPLENLDQRYIPDVAHPFPVVLWKPGPPQPIVRYKQRTYKIRYHPGVPLRFNVETGRWVGPTEAAHLIVTITCPADVEAWLRNPDIMWPNPLNNWTIALTPIDGKICFKGGRDLREPYDRPGVTTTMLTQERIEEVIMRDEIEQGFGTMFSADSEKIYGRLGITIDWGLGVRNVAEMAQREGWLRIRVNGSVNLTGSPDLTPDPDRITKREGLVTYLYDPEKGYYEDLTAPSGAKP